MRSQKQNVKYTHALGPMVLPMTTASSTLEHPSRGRAPTSGLAAEFIHSPGTISEFHSPRTLVVMTCFVGLTGDVPNSNPGGWGSAGL